MELRKTLFFTAVVFSTMTVSRAAEPLFVPEGGSVRLDVPGYEELQFHTLSWKFNGSAFVLKYFSQSKGLIQFEGYDTAAEVDEKNFSLLLKNVSQRHSGNYTAWILNEGKERCVATRWVTVQGQQKENSNKLSIGLGTFAIIIIIIIIIIVSIISIIIICKLYKRNRITSGGSQIHMKCKAEYASVKVQDAVAPASSALGGGGC
ncbi:uncharacterized protein LOC118208190 [Anguilla anguilla]|uniref:uncharacterized protein LOC118208190 n=1 Tax=Anguilla anguilla TaxID=7936 RepID=UPI0015A88B27|nr:uncharacterized protein LOC118208190 [Anguilla anguilla]